MSGMVPYAPFKKTIPKADPPSPLWCEAVGDLSIRVIEASVSDSVRLRAEVETENDLGPLIPLVACLIRGGSYRPDLPALTFEEEHRLLAIARDRIVFSRSDDLLDFWTMLRSMIDLIVAAWERRSILEPERQPRQGVGAIEVFKRLPGTNCGECGSANCMEFATRLFMGRCQIEKCPTIFEPKWTRNFESLQWLISAIGVSGLPQGCSGTNSTSQRIAGS